MDHFSYSLYLRLSYISTILVVSTESSISPPGRIVVSGSNVTFTCNIERFLYSKKVYWWYHPETRSDDSRNAENLPGVKCSNLTQGGPIQLNITGVTSSHAGRYSCNPDGETNDITSELIVLDSDLQCRVFVPYQIGSESQLYGTKFCTDNFSIYLTCIVSHNNELFVKSELWRSDGQRVVNTPISKFHKDSNVITVHYRIKEIQAHYNVSIQLSTQPINSSGHIPTINWTSPNIERIYSNLCNTELPVSTSETTANRLELIFTTEGFPSTTTTHTTPASTFASVTTESEKINPAGSTYDSNEVKIILIAFLGLTTALLVTFLITKIYYRCTKARNTNILPLSVPSYGHLLSQLQNDYLRPPNDDSSPTISQVLNINNDLHRHYEEILDQPNETSNNIQSGQRNMNNLTPRIDPETSQVNQDKVNFTNDQNLPPGYLRTLPFTPKPGKIERRHIPEGLQRPAATIPKQMY